MIWSVLNLYHLNVAVGENLVSGSRLLKLLRYYLVRPVNVIKLDLIKLVYHVLCVLMQSYLDLGRYLSIES
jgi:hypothetical protein